jgi:hypothetical protein
MDVVINISYYKLSTAILFWVGSVLDHRDLKHSLPESGIHFYTASAEKPRFSTPHLRPGI